MTKYNNVSTITLNGARRLLLGYGKKSWLLQVKLVVEHAAKRRWNWIFRKGGKK